METREGIAGSRSGSQRAVDFQQHGRLTPTPRASLHQVDQSDFQETSESRRPARRQPKLVSKPRIFHNRLSPGSPENFRETTIKCFEPNCVLCPGKERTPLACLYAAPCDGVRSHRRSIEPMVNDRHDRGCFLDSRSIDRLFAFLPISQTTFLCE